MKRFLSSLLVLCLMVCLLPLCVRADNAYFIEEAGLHISIPEDYIVFTRDFDPSDPNLKAFEIDGAWLSSNMYNYNVYLDGVRSDATSEILVTITDSDFEDFSQLSDKSLTSLVDILMEWFPDIGFTPTFSEIVRYSQAKYVKFYQYNSDINSVLYVTVHAGKNIVISLNSYTGTLEPHQETLLETILESTRYETVYPQDKTPEETPSFLFRDSETMLHFTVPENWVQLDTDPEVDDFKGHFVSTANKTTAILYGSFDIYPGEQELADYSFLDRINLVRDTMDNTFIEWYIEEMYGSDNPTVSMVTYGDLEYYQVEIEDSIPQMPYTYDSVFLIRNDHGRIYTYYFSRGRDDPHYADFEKLVSSASYDTPPERLELARNVKLSVLLLCIAGILLVCILFILIWRFAIYRRSDKRRSAGNKRHSMAYCHLCGTKLTPDSRFCRICGTRVPTEE